MNRSALIPSSPSDPDLLLALSNLRQRVRQVGAHLMLHGEVAAVLDASARLAGLEPALLEIEAAIAWLERAEPATSPTPSASALPQSEAAVRAVTPSELQRVVPLVPERVARVNGVTEASSELHAETLALPQVESNPLPPKPEPGLSPHMASLAEASVPVETETPEQLAQRKEARRARGKQAEAAYRALANEERELNRLSINQPGVFSRTKGVVCGLQAVAQEYHDLSHGDNARTLIEELQRQSSAWPVSVFYGFNEARYETTETWQHLAAAYRHVGEAEVHLAQGQRLPSGLPTAVLQYASVAIAVLDRTLFWETTGAFDHVVKDLPALLTQLSPGMTLHRIDQPEDLPYHLEWLEALQEESRQSLTAGRNVEARQAAMQALIAATSQPGDDFEANLNAAVRQALAAGIPPSSKELKHLLMPFRQLLEPSEDLRVLQRNLDIEMVQLNKRAVTIVEDTPENEDVVRMRTELQAFLAGKTVLFLGGRKVHANKIDELKRALGCAELLWPDADDDTHIRTFDAPMRRSDLVAQVIRWSRHSYKEVLDDAKALGKSTAQIFSGLGENRVIHDLHLQLLGGPRD